MTVYELIRELSRNDDPNQPVVFIKHEDGEDDLRPVTRVLFSTDKVYLDDGEVVV